MKGEGMEETVGETRDGQGGRIVDWSWTAIYRPLAGVEDCILMDIEGDLSRSHQSGTGLEDMIDRLVAEGWRRFVFDLAKVSWMSSGAIGTFIHCLKGIVPAGGNLALLHLQPKLKEIFELLGFEAFFRFPATLEEAAGLVSLPFVANDGIVPGFDAEACPGLEAQLLGLSDVEGGLMVNLRGDASSFPVEAHLRRMDKAIDAGYLRLVFDFTRVHSAASSPDGQYWAFLCLRAFMKRVRPLGGEVVAVLPDPGIAQVGAGRVLDPGLKVYSSCDEATGYFRRSGQGKDARPRNRPPPPPLEDPPVAVDCVCPACGATTGTVLPGRLRCHACGTSIRVFPGGKAVSW
jgi:anti-sigma B factor antagonist